MKFISPRLAAYGILLILSLIIIFHLLVITGVIPFQIVWGGRLTNHEEMIRFESISIVANLFMIAVVCAKVGLFGSALPRKLVNGILWAMVVLFALNTLGNIFSNNSLERAIFTPLTLLLALFCYKLATAKVVLQRS